MLYNSMQYIWVWTLSGDLTFRHIIRQPFPAKTFPTSELVVPEIIKIGENWLYNCTVSLTNHWMSDKSYRFLLLSCIFSHNHENGNNKLQPQSVDQTSASMSRPNFSHHCQCIGAYQYSPGKTINTGTPPGLEFLSLLRISEFFHFI